MDLKIDGGDVNRLVAEAVLNSTIGDQIKAAVAKSMADLSRSWENPIEGVIKNHIAVMVREILVAEYSDTLRAAIAKSLASKMTDEYIGSVCEAVTDKYRR